MFYTCHLCGYPEQNKPPWTQEGLSPSYEICPCCGIEFGVDDINLLGFEIYKREWFEKGRDWFDQAKRPVNWEQEEQLKSINKIKHEELPFYLLDAK
ncbi:hypothetical protein [Paenibacillus silvisoli]|uniref:hypothetical protein n=1 Tax=Paenibacillus silvisoli TaxID=3110539 RepID=UPI002803FABF|nr:hypothetical protein [Paenibacillus silvisoli]